MNRLNFSNDVRCKKLVRKILCLLTWFESDEGFFSSFYKDEPRTPMGFEFNRRVTMTYQKVRELLDTFPCHDFLIDFRGWEYPIDAYCEFAGIIRRIEKERNLPVGSLWARFVILCDDGNDEAAEELLRQMEAQETAQCIRILTTRAGGDKFVSPTMAAFAKVGL